MGSRKIISQKMKIFPIILILNTSANDRADDSIDQLIEIRQRAKKLVDGPGRWHQNMVKNILSITDAMIRRKEKTDTLCPNLKGGSASLAIHQFVNLDMSN